MEYDETLLEALGEQDIDTLEDFFTNDAVLIVARQRDGRFRNTVQTAKDWLHGMRQNPGIPFEERLANIETTVDGEQLAYLRADFEIVREGKVVSHGVDVFTLLRDGRPMEDRRDRLHEFSGRQKSENLLQLFHPSELAVERELVQDFLVVLCKLRL